MDKLQPIIRQRFWILFGLCLILGMVGFFKAQSAIVAATETREQLLAKTKNDVPPGTGPSDDYKAKMAFINEAYAKKVAEATRELFSSQTSRMWWDDLVAAEIPAKHRDPEHEIAPSTAVKYSKIYQRMIENVWKKVDPVVPKSLPGVRAESATDYTGAVTWTPKVYCALEDLPQKLLSRAPASDSIWDAQEDLWFVELILEAVHNANRQADSPLNAVVRTIERLELRGGAGRTEGGETAVEDEDNPIAAMMAMRNSMGNGPASSMSPYGGGGGFTAPTAFDPTEELGSDAITEVEGGEEEESPMAAMIAMRSAMGGGGNGMPGLRWVAKDDSAPFRERGFYLSVVMQQSRIPDFMIELTNAPWPIQILRFQMGPNPRAAAMSPQSGMGGGYGGYQRSMTSSPMGGSNTMGASAAMMRTRGGRPGGMGGGMGGPMGGRQGAGLSFINNPVSDPFVGSLNSPDLVQVDLVGIITFYVPQNEDGTAAVETPDVDTPDVPEPVEEVPAEGEQPGEGEQPADGEMTVPADAGDATNGQAPATQTPAEATEVPEAEAGSAAPAESPPPEGAATESSAPPAS